MGKKVIWTKNAEAELQKAFFDLFEKSKSIEMATRIITAIHESAFILSSNSDIYKVDQLRINNAGNIRAYEKHTYRISYQIEAEAVYIIRVRYARKEPLEY